MSFFRVGCNVTKFLWMEIKKNMHFNFTAFGVTSLTSSKDGTEIQMAVLLLGYIDNKIMYITNKISRM